MCHISISICDDKDFGRSCWHVDGDQRFTVLKIHLSRCDVLITGTEEFVHLWTRFCSPRHGPNSLGGNFSLRTAGESTKSITCAPPALSTCVAPASFEQYRTSAAMVPSNAGGVAKTMVRQPAVGKNDDVYPSSTATCPVTCNFGRNCQHQSTGR